MCGRFSFFDIAKFYTRFNIQNRIDSLQGHYNIAPGSKLPVIIRELNDNKADLMLWGLIPIWATDPKMGYKMINARSESLQEKVAFKKPFKSQRCIIPCNGFYEWKKKDKDKTPYYIRRKDKDLFGLAGLYDMWQDPKGKKVKSFTIVTTKPNKELKDIHDRMPVILDQENENNWMDMDTDITNVLKYLEPFKEGELETYPVSKKVNTPKYDDLDLITPNYDKQNTLL